MTLIIPAVLATTEAEYLQYRVALTEITEIEWVQIDFMDNKFVHSQSISPQMLIKHPLSQKIEAQLMVSYPLSWVDQLAQAGVKRVIFPVEDNQDIPGTITQIKQLGMEVGLSLNPETPVEKVAPFMSTIEVVLVMSVHPGFAGQQFLRETFAKVKKLTTLRRQLGGQCQIEVDGGVTEANAEELVELGVDSLVIGSHLFKGEIKTNVEHFRKIIQARG